MNLLVDIGEACAEYHDANVRGLSCNEVQVDEIWGFCYCKEKNVPIPLQGKDGLGDVWTWVAVEAKTKLIISYLVGKRTPECAHDFIFDLASRIDTRIQLTSDGLPAIRAAFGDNIDYAQLIKEYGVDRLAEARHSPSIVLSVEVKPRIGQPNEEAICTSFIERQNLTMRMGMRRLTRLTNGFSKKFENMVHAVALNFTYYNFARIHQTLRVTPAMEQGIADHVWEVEELVSLLV